jgi:hypothetical protein
MHLSRVEVQKQRRGGSHLSEHKDASEWTKSSIIGRITVRVDGSTTRRLPLYRTPPTPSRTRSPVALPPHLQRTLEAMKKTLPRSLVPCRSVPLGHQAGKGRQTRPGPRGEPGETRTEASASGTSTTTTTKKPLERPPGYSLPPISELRRRAANYTGRSEWASEPPEHFKTGDWIARNIERRRRRPPSPDGAPPPLVRSPRGTLMHADGR